MFFLGFCFAGLFVCSVLLGFSLGFSAGEKYGKPRSTTLSKKKLEDFFEEMTDGLEKPYCARFSQHFSPVNYGAPCKYCGKKPTDKELTNQQN